MMNMMIKIILMMNIIAGNEYDNIFHVVYVYNSSVFSRSCANDKRLCANI